MAQIGELTNLKSLLPQTDDRTIRRGEIYYADLEDVAYCCQYVKQKTRPVLIIQNDVGNTMSNTVIVALISHQYSKPYPFQLRTKVGGDLSTIQFNQVMTLDKFRILNYIDTLSQCQMEQAEKALMCSLDLSKFSLENILGFDVTNKITKVDKCGSKTVFTFRFDLADRNSTTLRVSAQALTEFDPTITDDSGIDSVRKKIDCCIGLHWIVTHISEFEI